MESIILIGDKNFTLSTIEVIKHKGCIKQGYSFEDRYYVDYNTDRIYYDIFKDDDDLRANFFEDEFMNKIYKLFSEPKVISMLYRTKNRLMEVLRQDDFPRGLYVDNDHGLFMPIEEFIILDKPFSIF